MQTFLSTLSLRRATFARIMNALSGLFLSTLSLRRATKDTLHALLEVIISIHALLAESDVFAPPVNGGGLYFYPRSPCGERLEGNRAKSFEHYYFYPRSPCGERRKIKDFVYLYNFISIHALLAESDSTQNKHPPHITHFYPRSPCGERRESIETLRTVSVISIHALLAESDFINCYSNSTQNISIHALLAESDI